VFSEAGSYDRFMGRYSGPLAPVFAEFAGVEAGQRALDVGCGPGALVGALVERLGQRSVNAVDPSSAFVDAVRARYPGVETEVAPAERLPFASGSFDAALAQLVVHFMTDPVAGLRELRRVTRPGGVVAACVWDCAGGGGPLSRFWDAARELDPDVEDESGRAGARAGHLGELFAAAGLQDVEEAALTVEVEHASFEEWWEPFTLGVGPAGAYVAGLTAARRDELRSRCERSFARHGPVVAAAAWAARARPVN